MGCEITTIAPRFRGASRTETTEMRACATVGWTVDPLFYGLDEKGAVVPEMDNRKGRRKINKLPYHPDCADAMAEREVKWEKLEAEAVASATSA